MDNPNKALWARAFKTDPAKVKAITGKQYKGNSPAPYHIVERLTDEFGPCGIGWGPTIVSERFERLTDTDVLHVAVVRLWYVLDGKRGEVEQIGQTMAAYKKKDGGMHTDEDAPKKSVTDALVKCASYLGFAGDIFSGRWDDSKYVAALRDEFADDGRQAARDAWLKAQFALIDAAKTAGDLKKVVAAARATAQSEDDDDAETQIMNHADAKVAKAKAAKPAKEGAEA